MNVNDQLELSSIFENVPPPGKKNVAVIIGRFNPPTKGHYLVIDEVKKFIRDNKNLKLEAAPVVVVIGGGSSDSDKKRNPLSVDDRILFMQSSGQANGVTFLSAKNAFDAFSLIRKNGFEPIAIAAGSDRAQDYIRILDKYFTGADGSPIKHHVIEIKRDTAATETKKSKKEAYLDSTIADLKSGGEIDSDLISGSLARRAVELGFEPEFAKIVGLEAKPELAKKMFKKISSAIKD